MKATATTSGKRRSKATSSVGQEPMLYVSADRSEHISVSAYYKALARGFSPGQELDDWLEAEREVGADAGQ